MFNKAEVVLGRGECAEQTPQKTLGGAEPAESPRRKESDCDFGNGDQRRDSGHLGTTSLETLGSSVPFAPATLSSLRSSSDSPTPPTILVTSAISAGQPPTAHRDTPHSGEKTEISGHTLTPGEVGEELETKSGSSHTSARGVADCGVNTQTDRAKVNGRIAVLVEGKRRELREEVALTETVLSEIELLRQELRWLAEDKNAGMKADEIHRNWLKSAERYEESRLKYLTVRSDRPLPSLLHMKKQPPKPSAKRILTSLDLDIAGFISDIEAWQRSVQQSMSLVVEKVSALVKATIPGAEVHVYGSFASGMHLPSSDIDLLVAPPSTYTVHQTLHELSLTCSSQPWVCHSLYITQAYIPVLQLIVIQDDLKVRLDVTVEEEKHRGLQCTEIVKRLTGEMDMIRSVFLTLKQLCHGCGANVTFKGGLGSYSLFVMTAALLQRERLRSPGEYVFRFFQHYAYEFQYTTAIALTPLTEDSVFPPALRILDPSAPAFNTARATSLSFLLVTYMQNFLRAAATSLVSRTACNCSVSRRVLAKVIAETRTWVGCLGRGNFAG